MAPPRFRIPSNASPSATPLSPPSTNVPSNGLFSPESTPHGPQRSHPSTLFAGATPSARSAASRFGGKGNGGSTASAPFFGFSAPGGVGASNRIPQFDKPVSESAFATTQPVEGARKASRVRSKYMSHSGSDNGEDNTGSPRIFEDDSRGEKPTPQDDEDMADDDDDGDGDDDDDDSEGSGGMLDDSGSDSDGDDSFHVLPAGSSTPRNTLLGTEGKIKCGIVTEPGALILQTEELMQELHTLMKPTSQLDYDSELEDHDMVGINHRVPPSASKKEEYLTRSSRLFLESLASYLRKDKPKSRLHKAYYLTSLLLPMHHSRSSVTESLRKWLYAHMPSPTKKELLELKSFYPNPVFCHSFWTTLHKLILRGEVLEALDLLRSADWDKLAEDSSKFPKPAIPQSQGPTWERKYTEGEVDSIKTAVAAMIELLNLCPGRVRSSYARPPGSVEFFPMTATPFPSKGDWRIWQGRVYAAMDTLRNNAAGDGDATLDETDDSYYANYRPRNGGSYGIGIGTPGRGRERKAPIPNEVLGGLRTVYDIMKGDRDAVITITDRWEEAVLGVMMWGSSEPIRIPNEHGNHINTQEDEDDEDDGDGMYTDGNTKALNRRRRERELRRLERVTVSFVEGDMPLDPTNDMEIAVAACMVWDPTVVLETIPQFSLLVATTLVELCGIAGSIQRTPVRRVAEENGVMDGFDDDELAVFSMGRGSGTEAEKADGVVKEYGAGLFGVKWVNRKAVVEGWEVAVGVLQRVRGGMELSQKLLPELELTTKSRVEKLLTYCGEVGFTNEAIEIAASFAECLSGTTSYGDSLQFYSLANDQYSLHNILTKLVTATLLHSAPFPSKSSLDPALSTLLSTPPPSIPSPLLRFELSGYATLRAFYEYRDSGDHSRAVKCLIAVLKSAAEKLDGGIYDPDWGSSIEEWTISALLGELLPYLLASPQQMYTFSMQEALDVVRVITDFEIVAGDVARRADEFLERVLARCGVPGNPSGDKAPAAGIQSGSSSSSSSWESIRTAIDDGTIVGEHAQEKVWDWREGARGWKTRDIIRVVRLRVAKLLSEAWL